jgi:hypothetical protein
VATRTAFFEGLHDGFMPAAPSIALRTRPALAALFALALASPGAGATVLYKSISPTGVVQFSDTPPENGVVVEQRLVISDAQGAGGAPMELEMVPLTAFMNPLGLPADGIAPDDAIAQANAQVDLAEHQLALARNGTWDRREGLRLAHPRRGRGDDERIAFYERNLAAARAKLLALLGKPTMREAGAPYVVAGSLRPIPAPKPGTDHIFLSAKQ